MIIGLTDDAAPRFPRLGKLRKGDERPESGKAPGKDTDHFRFDANTPATLAAFIAAYGAAPNLLHVYLPYQTPEANFASWKEAWSAGGLLHRCDGVTCTIWRTNAGKYSREPKPCPGGCKEVGRLELVLPELIQAGFVGYVTLETHSNHDLRNITAALQAAYQNRRRDLRGIEWTLQRVQQEISTPTADGGRARREKWLVFLTPSVRWAQLQLAISQSLAMRLPAPTAETVDAATGEIVDGFDAPAPDPAKVEAAITRANAANAETVKHLTEQAAANKAKADAEIAKAKAAQSGMPAPKAGALKPTASPAPKPANGNGGKKLKDMAPKERFDTLWAYGLGLGLKFPSPPHGAVEAVYDEQARQLWTALFQRARQILPVVNQDNEPLTWPETVGTLKAAVKQYEADQQTDDAGMQAPLSQEA